MTRIAPPGDRDRPRFRGIDAHNRFLFREGLHRRHVHGLRQIDEPFTRVGGDHARIACPRGAPIPREIDPTPAAHADAPHVVVVADQRKAAIGAPAHHRRARPVHIVVVFRVDERDGGARGEIHRGFRGHVVRVKVAVIPEEHGLPLGGQRGGPPECLPHQGPRTRPRVNQIQVALLHAVIAGLTLVRLVIGAKHVAITGAERSGSHHVIGELHHRRRGGQIGGQEREALVGILLHNLQRLEAGILPVPENERRAVIVVELFALGHR